MDFLGIGPWEALLIIVIALIFVGPGKIVSFARTLGKWTRAIKNVGGEFTAAVTREIEKAENEVKAPLTMVEKPAAAPVTATVPPQPAPIAPPPLMAANTIPEAKSGGEVALNK